MEVITIKDVLDYIDCGMVNNNFNTNLSNPESYVLKYASFNTYMVLLFTDENKAQIYKMPYRDN